jgi:hypothetical protein
MDKDQIFKILEEKGANLPCSSCGNNNFILLDGYIYPIVKQDLNQKIESKFETIISIATVCNKCGYIRQHSIGALGLMPEEFKQSRNNLDESQND